MSQKHTEKLIVTSDAFEPGGEIPVRYTGRGEDISPSLTLSALSEEAKSIAIIMDDLDHPISGYNHWTLWNIPVLSTIPENIPHGPVVDSLEGAVQGVGYGRHQYRGPKPPKFMRGYHRYQFHVYVLDCKLALPSKARKKALLQSMEGHILQYGSITGKFRNRGTNC